MTPAPSEPPALSEHAVERFIGVLGNDAVLMSDDERHEFRDPYWPAGDDCYAESAVLLPSTVEEVQAVVRIANELKIALWTSSQGRNYGYGGPSPRVRGSVVVSLRRMNRVLEINEELAYAVLEPGVRWFDLCDAIKAGGHDLLASIPDIGWGSVVGNSLDNGITYQPYGADFMAPCGLEVVLPDGEVLRTGMGAIPDNKSWHLYKRGLGPTLDPLFMQSNYGIVTRMGYWLMRKPEAYAPLTLSVTRDSELEMAVDTVRELRLDGTLRGVPSMFNTLVASSQFPETLDGYEHQSDGVLPDEAIQSFADETGLGRWGVRTALWGDAAIVECQLAKVKEVWNRIPNSRVVAERFYGRDEYDEIAAFPDRVLAGIPSLHLVEAMPANGGHIGFSPVVPLVGREVREVVDLMSGLVETEMGVNLQVGICVINERSCVVVGVLSIDLSDEQRTRRAYATAKLLVEEAGRRGYGEYRAHLDFMDLASDQYSFGGHAYRSFCESIKDAVDPNGILAPGRHGIWPSAMREHRIG